MKPHSNFVHHHRIALGDGLSLPEYRHIDLYDKKKKLVFLDDSAAENSAQLSLLNAVRIVQVALDDHLSAQDALLGESVSSWQRYLSLPRTSQTDKLVAEVFRILRIVRICVTHAQGHLEVRDGLIRMSCNFGGCMLSLNITSAGLGLLGSFVVYYLESFAQPHGETYVEWMLSQYFTDLVDEIRKFSDEDRVLFQFQRKAFFNRHFRFDCDHPRVSQSDDHYTFEIGKFHADRAVYPIDFYVVLDNCLHIVPVEALKDGRLACEQLPRWKARCPDNESLPGKYRHRFVRDRMVVGLPMT
jgi:hypothetical protein